VIPILKEKRIVKEKRLRAESNQKLYSLVPFRAIIFLNNLFAKERLEEFWTYQENARKAAKKLNNNKVPMLSLRLKSFISNISDSEVIVPEDLQKKHHIKISGPCRISELIAPLADEIIMNCFLLRYCPECVAIGLIGEMRPHEGTLYCDRCNKQIEEGPIPRMDIIESWEETKNRYKTEQRVIKKFNSSLVRTSHY
jgi:hypothetical protein